MSDFEKSLRELIAEVVEETVRKILREELNKFFEERFKNDNGSIQSVHNNIDDLRNVGVQNLQISVNQLKDNYGSFKNLIETQKGKLDGLERTVNQIQIALNGFNGDLSNIKNKISDIERPSGILDSLKNGVGKLLSSNEQNVKRLENELADAKTTISNKNSELDKANKELNQAHTQLTNLKNDLTTTQTELANAQNTISNKNSELDKANEELNQARIQVDSLKNDLTTTQAELNEARESANKTGEKLKAWTSSTDIYAIVRDAITKCSTFSKIVEEYKLNDMTDSGLMTYAQVLGKTQEFIVKIGECAVDIKKNTKEPMTAEEVQVYDALNKAYRQIWNIEHDIFILPGGQSVTSNFQKTNFDANFSICLTDMRNKSFSYTTGIYVPIVFNKDNQILQKGYVDAGNR